MVPVSEFVKVHEVLTTPSLIIVFVFVKVFALTNLPELLFVIVPELLTPPSFKKTP